MSSPISVPPTATASEAASLIAEHRAGAVVVLDEASALIGILSERDIVARVVARNLDPTATRVADIMTTEVLTAEASDSSESAILTMAVGHVRQLPVVDANGAVLEMLSVLDLLEEQLGALSRRNADLVNFISADGGGG